MLEKKNTLFSRDEQGILIPEEVELEIRENDDEQLQYKDETIEIIPMGRGEIKKMFRDLRVNEKKEDSDELDIDANLIAKHCTTPKYSLKEIEHLKPPLPSIIVNTILRESGISSGKSKKKAIEEAEDEFSKNSKESKLTEKKQI